jgi:hypothetical protein
MKTEQIVGVDSNTLYNWGSIMEDKNIRNIGLGIIIIILLLLIAVLALPVFGPGPFRTSPACDLEFLHVKIVDNNENDTLRMVARGTTPNVDLEFFVNDRLVAERTVSPEDVINIQGDFGDVDETVDVEVITIFDVSRYKEPVTIQSS